MRILFNIISPTWASAFSIFMLLFTARCPFSLKKRIKIEVEQFYFLYDLLISHHSLYLTDLHLPCSCPKQNHKIILLFFTAFCITCAFWGLSWWLSLYRIHLQCRRPGFVLWVGKIPPEKGTATTPVFWPGEFH